MMTRSACGNTIRRVRWRLEAQRHRGFALAPADRENSGANDFGDKRPRVDDEAEQQRGEFRRHRVTASEVEALQLGTIEGERRAAAKKDDQRQPEYQR
jgi:hypothetical protein